MNKSINLTIDSNLKMPFYILFTDFNIVMMQLAVADWTRKDPFYLMVVVKRTQKDINTFHVLFTTPRVG